MRSKDAAGRAVESGSIESWLVSAGRDRRPGSPLNVPPWPASNFVLGERRAYSRDDGTPGWEALEVERAQRSAMTLAERLAHHPNVSLTRYPGLPTHPTHAAAHRQFRGFGTIISFDVRGDASTADAVCARLQLIQHATSLGAVESTIERRASVPGQEHLPPALLRLSVGIEAVEDLWTDLDVALRGS